MNINEKPTVKEISENDYIFVSTGGKLRRIRDGDATQFDLKADSDFIKTWEALI